MRFRFERANLYHESLTPDQTKFIQHIRIGQGVLPKSRLLAQHRAVALP